MRAKTRFSIHLLILLKLLIVTHIYTTHVHRCEWSEKQCIDKQHGNVSLPPATMLFSFLTDIELDLYNKRSYGTVTAILHGIDSNEEIFLQVQCLQLNLEEEGFLWGQAWCQVCMSSIAGLLGLVPRCFGRWQKETALTVRNPTLFTVAMIRDCPVVWWLITIQKILFHAWKVFTGGQGLFC